MKILVTGATGYIASHTCIELLEAGYGVVGVDNYSNSSPLVAKRIEQITSKQLIMYEADILDAEALDSIFKEHKIEAVIHFAGLKAVGESVVQPLLYYRNNVAGSIVLFEAMQRAGCKNIVFSSSATVYGLNNPIPYKEEYPVSAANPYGSTKIAIEYILNDLCSGDQNYSATLLRYFNPIGAHPSGLIGEDPNGIPNNLLPYICQVAIGKLAHLNIFGNDYDTIDGTGVRDYLHVVDLAKGHLLALEYNLKHRGSIAINLGTGKGTSVLEIISAFEKSSGVKIPYIFAPRRAGDIAQFYADASLAKKELEWVAQLGIEQMCKDSWNFINNRKNHESIKD